MVEGLPVFDTVAEAVEKTGADATMIFVPPAFTADAILEAADAGIRTIDRHHRGRAGAATWSASTRSCGGSGSRLIGPNCPGVITPEECKIGIMPGYIHQEGPGRRDEPLGTLTYEAVWQLTEPGAGPIDLRRAWAATRSSARRSSTCWKMFAGRPGTEAILMMGEIGGTAEEEAAALRRRARHASRWRPSSPAARPRPASGWATPAPSSPAARARPPRKIAALEAAGIVVAESPADMGAAVQRALQLAKSSRA